MSCRSPLRGLRAAPLAPRRGRGPAPYALLLLMVAASAAHAQGEPFDACPTALEQPGAALPTRLQEERVRCLEAQGRLEEAVPLLHRLAAAPQATVRERAYLALYRLGQEVALPAVGEAGALAPAPGCLHSLWADRYAWAEGPGTRGTRASGTAALLFSTVPELASGDGSVEAGEPAGPPAWLGEGSGDAARAEPETGRPEDRVSETGGALDLLVSGVEETRDAETVRAGDVQCTVLVADACSGRVGVVCEDRGGLPPPTEDLALPFPLPPERLEVKEFQLP